MSEKGRGAKIVIQFTEGITSIPSGAENAFTITGKERPYVGGPLIDAIYDVVSVDLWSYPLSEDLMLDDGSISEGFETTDIDPRINLTGTWARSNRTAQTGQWSLESDNKLNSTDTSAYLTFKSSAGKSFSLGYRVSSESNYDKLYIYHNGTVLPAVNGISGNGEWSTYTGITTEGENVIRARYTKDGSVASNLDAGFIDNIVIPGWYDPQKIAHITLPSIDAEHRIMWERETPEGTGIVVELDNGDGQWSTIQSGYSLIPNPAKTLKITLTTNDEEKTPILRSLRLEAVDDRKLRLTMQPITGRFHNVEGQLTVAYSSALGQLAGRGGLVADFSRAFTPTELEPVPHQNDAENIEIAGISVTATRTRVYYTNGYGPENIELASISATGTLTHIDDL